MIIKAKQINALPIDPPPATLKNGHIFGLIKSERKGCPYSINSITFNPGGTIDEQTHDDEHFIYVVEGTICIKIGDTEHLVSEGKFINIPSNHNHGFENKTTVDTRIIILKI